MSKRSCDKYQGTGNSFLLIDDRDLSFPVHDLSLIRSLSSGVDGVILLQPTQIADFQMRIFNRDGSEAEGCGNGLRCLLRFLIDLGLPKKSYRIALSDRIVTGRFIGERIAIELGPPRHFLLHQTIGPWTVHSIDTGVPHAVVFVPDVSSIDLLRDAPFLRAHPHFHPRGTNVNFAAVQSKNTVQIRTFERGVEGETQSCGTGAAAVATIAIALQYTSNPTAIHCLGGVIEVQSSDQGVQIIGAAQKLSIAK